MPFQGTYLLAAIDGTDSREWGEPLPRRGNSHTYDFYRRFRLQGAQDKAYWDGPDGATGSRTEGIANGVTDFLHGRIRHHTGGRTRRVPTMNRSVRPSGQSEEIRIILVGHSRGGLIAINVARRMPFPVYFLALYDAVDRYIGLSGDHISNVRFTYHARRDPDFESRESFGNTGLASAQFYDEELFMTSHGGVGGAPDLEPDQSFFSTADLTCENNTVRGGAWSIQGLDLEQNCIDESRHAHNWMLSKARYRNLPL